ncbi:unnamed protein product [Toxocara canis]|uniref:Coatomer subunit delta n=1 Tax=Toxocara canis TaxID=6265 RepID=A0A183U4G8_TOXCA|nr:unnamed protein product [Toxocara canis]
MEKLIVSVKSTVERSSVCYPLLEIMRTDPCNLLADAFKASAPDPWADFRQYSINSSPQKRHASLGGPASKRIKKEDVPPVAVSADFHSEKMLPIPEKRVVVECKDGSQIELSQEASEQLSSARFRFDTDILPISSECVEVQVLIENDSLLVPPLRLVVPVNYPENGASIWKDQWSFGGHSLNDVNVQFEKRLAMTTNCGSISEIINAWRIASEHAIRISGK